MSLGGSLRRRAGLALAMLVVGSCDHVPTATPVPPTAVPIATSRTRSVERTLTASPEPPPEHRIGVRVVDGVGEFYDRVTGEQFTPRGNNLVRLAWLETPGGGTVFHQSDFTIGLHDPARADGALRQMQAGGYNTVRVFLVGPCSDGCLGDPAGGLSLGYVANFVDFLERAREHGIYVIPVVQLPSVGGYLDLLNSTWAEEFAGANAHYLREGGIRAYTELWRGFIRALFAQGAPVDAILAYELENELFFESNLAPLSLTSGVVTTANGRSYDMALDQERARMIEEGLVYWIDTLRGEILALDPTALVTVGFFQPQEPHLTRVGDPRVIETRPAIWESSADFIDLHPYPGWGLTLPQYVDNFGMAGMEAKPIVMGEFGAARSSYSTEAAAARALHDWQVESCDYGFDGWLLWTWDTEEQTDSYNGLTGQGQIDRALAPVYRPDPCRAGAFDFFEHNLALGMHPVASRFLPDQPPSGAVDGTTSQWWGAGDFAPQWIQIDLGQRFSIGLIRLVIAQSPAGRTEHQVWVGSTLDQLSLLHTFEDVTVDSQVLEFTPENPVEDVRYMRVVTRESPSWVGWREIEVLAP